MKANGFFLLMFPFLWAASDKYWKEREQQIGAAETSAPPASPPSKPVLTQSERSAQNEEPEIPKMPVEYVPTPSPDSSIGEFTQQSDQELVRQFVLEARRMEQSDDLGFVMALYADEVLFFGQEVSRNDIRNDKARCWDKWPIRGETITSELSFKLIKPDEFEVTFQSSFRNENPVTQAWESGDLANRYLVRKTGKKLYIVEQSGKVTNGKSGGVQEVPSEEAFVTMDNRIITVPADLQKQIVLDDDSKRRKASRHVVEAVHLVRQTLLAEAKRDINDTMSRYAFEVKYFGSDLTSEAIWSDKEEYFKKWPTLQDEVTSKYRVSISSKPEFAITFSTKFKMINAEGDQERTGEIDHTFKLKVWHTGKELRISEQNGKVRNLKTRKIE